MAYKRSVIVTGGTANLGYHAALAIAKAHSDYLVVLASRTDKDHAAESINKSLKQNNTIFMQLDLADTTNVRSFVEKWIADPSKPMIQALVLNAGLQFPAGLVLTPEGVEKTFAIAHVGHALLFFLLCPYLPPNSRVVLTSSGTHDPAQKSGLPDAEYNTAEDLAHPPTDMIKIPGRKRYSTAKLCNVLFTYALARKLAEHVPDRHVTVNAMDPGLMPGTGLAREGSRIERWLWNSVLPHMIGLLRILVTPNTHTPAESGAALCRLAVGADVEGITGKYFEGLKEIKSSQDSYNEAKQEDLWKWTTNYLAKDEIEKAKFESLK
ncbi:short-chain dehydrogenase protein [Rutstroemia sp. NJR-2017a BVV2]|nr:short-chain dehydrogenase protein [Rutstroemia sp. NJR-2017a BVV2]